MQSKLLNTRDLAMNKNDENENPFLMKLILRGKKDNK